MIMMMIKQLLPSLTVIKNKCDGIYFKYVSLLIPKLMKFLELSNFWNIILSNFVKLGMIKYQRIGCGTI